MDSSQYEILAPQGRKIREHNQHQLDGQLMRMRVNFSHENRGHHFGVSVTNTRCWDLKVLLESSVAPEKVVTSRADGDDLNMACREIKKALLKTLAEVMREIRQTKKLLGLKPGTALVRTKRRKAS